MALAEELQALAEELDSTDHGANGATPPLELGVDLEFTTTESGTTNADFDAASQKSLEKQRTETILIAVGVAAAVLVVGVVVVGAFVSCVLVCMHRCLLVHLNI